MGTLNLLAGLLCGFVIGVLVGWNLRGLDNDMAKNPPKPLPRRRTKSPRAFTGSGLGLMLMAAVLIMCFGCAGAPKIVKVPIPVPCLDAPVAWEPVPWAALTDKGVRILLEQKEYDELGARLAASLIVLNANARLAKAAVDGCAKASAQPAPGLLDP